MTPKMYTAKASQDVEVCLSQFEIDRLFQQRLMELAGWEQGFIVKDGKVVKRSVYHTSHSSVQYDEIRDATYMDLAVDLVLGRLSHQRITAPPK